MHCRLPNFVVFCIMKLKPSFSTSSSSEVDRGEIGHTKHLYCGSSERIACFRQSETANNPGTHSVFSVMKSYNFFLTAVAFLLKYGYHI